MKRYLLVLMLCMVIETYAMKRKDTSEEQEKAISTFNLLEAIRQKDVDAVKRCISKGIPINSIFKRVMRTCVDSILSNPLQTDWTFLLEAIETDSAEIVELLLYAKADTTSGDDLDKSPLMYAIEKKNWAIVDLLITYGAPVNQKGLTGNTALMAAVKSGSSEVVKKLLELGADINAQMRFPKGYSALNFAVMQGDKEIVALLIKKGANIPARSAYSDTPLMQVVSQDRKEIAELLELCFQQEVQQYLKDPQNFVNKHDLDFTFDKGQTLLMLACIFGHTKIISLFKDSSVESVSSQDNYNRCAFDYALLFNLDSVAHCINIFDKKIDISQAQIYALIERAIKKGHLNLVNALISIGVEPTIELAQEARELGYLKIMHRLLFSYLARSGGNYYPQVGQLSTLFKS